MNEDYTLPSNSETLNVDETSARFSGATWYEHIQTKKVALAGLGGIGSWVALMLARVKVEWIHLWDPDTVETVNMAGQLFGNSDIGNHKTSAVTDCIMDYADYHNYIAHRERITSDTTMPLDVRIFICGFDNMEARKTFFEKWCNIVRCAPKEKRKEYLFIDGRLAVEEFQVLCIKGDDEYNINRYCEQFLFTDEEADAVTCSYKQTTYMASMIASVIANLFINFVTNECDPIIERDLPFFTSYSADTMYFKTEA
jgi:hypothetical protein